MRVFVTGGAGFIGRSVCRQLRARGDDVVAVVRDPGRATDLEELGCEVRAGDLSSPEALTGGMRSCDGVIHLAGSYRIGIPARERPQMYEANVGATHRVLEAAIATGVSRIVHVSSVNALGNTREKIVDETYRRDLSQGFLSYYDETKHLAHVAARELISSGAQVLIAMPGTTYGPGDHSALGGQLQMAYEGRLRVTGLTEVGISPSHVDDVAGGIIATLDAGPDRRVVHPGRTQHAPARGARGRGPGRWSSAAATYRADRSAPRHRPARADRSQALRPTAELRRGHQRVGRRDVLGVVDQGQPQARLHAA